MSLTSTMIGVAERLPLPDLVVRTAIARMCARTAAALSDPAKATAADFAAATARRAVAEHTDKANIQHYEVPAAFFGHVLGPKRKYSCCYYGDPGATLEDAETAALQQTIAHASLADGQSILELGCGWGALSLEIAGLFPHAEITAVSNSGSQRAHIEGEALKAGLRNLRVITADMNRFEPEARFDRIVSVEMFEHMMNWRALLKRVRSWLAGKGELFLHIFSHRSGSYAFDHANSEDWIARHFFTGGVMPSHDLIRQYADIFQVEQEWRWNGQHYQRTARDWLARFDHQRDTIESILRSVYGEDTPLWMRRWRWFFLATAGLFGFADGNEWGVSHFRLKPAD
jgi:cyclopropane-fatty-acyl-phospholipid synthase